MKFIFIINKWANFYFFIQNLSEWHFSNRRNYNQMWKKEFGPFSTKEKDALKKFKKIHLKYSFGKRYLGRPFFLRKNPWRDLKKQLLKIEFIDLKNIFSIFKPKFKMLYEKDLPLFIKWQKKLREKANNKVLIDLINKVLANLYNTSSLRKTIKVYLLFSSSTTFGGGANIDTKNVALEISRYPLKKIKSAIGCIWHEVIHTCFENYYFLPLLRKKFPKDQDAVDLVREITIRVVFFPGGILEKKILKISTPINEITKKYTQSLFSLRELVKKYIQKNKHFDKEYIEKTFALFCSLKGVIR